ncbi:MAG: hypothetical protein ACRDGS_06640 [Chloroflexota bacterium]
MRRFLPQVTAIAVLIAAVPLASTGGTVHAQAAGSIFGSNLIVNGDAEANPGNSFSQAVGVDARGWKATGMLRVLQYEAQPNDKYPEYPTMADPGPSARGKNYFAGGAQSQGNQTTATQIVAVADGAKAIDTGKVTFTLSGYLGGGGKFADTAGLKGTFKGADGAVLGSAKIDPVSPADRNNTTGMLQRSISGKIPVKTRTIAVDLQLKYVALPGETASHSMINAYADSLSLVLSVPALTVTMVQPTQQAALSGKTIPFAWRGFSGATYYYLQAWLVKPADGQTITPKSVLSFATQVSDTRYALKTDGLAKGQYQWRVVAADTNGAVIADWAAPASFTLK